MYGTTEEHGTALPAGGSAPGELSTLRAENARLAARVADLERKLSLQPQTGLPTHFRLELELDDLIESLRSRGDGEGFSLLIVQLGDTYAIVRKTLKASVSEWILYQTGCRISGLLRPEDKVFHTHEGEFVLILPGLKGQALSTFLRSLSGKLAEPHIFSGYNVGFKTATGVAYWPEHGRERSDIMHAADIAVGAASEGRKPFVLFKPDLLRRVVERVELQNSIIKAIESPSLERLGEQFVMFYQPKLFASALEDGVLSVDRVEAEALIRWRHPTKGLLGPSTFIPLAEETGLILPLGKWLVYQCARRLAAWEKEGRIAHGVSVNLSARQFRSEDVVDVLASALASTGVSPERLTVEVTETSLFDDPVSAAQVLKRFSALGLRVSVDDFGTGYSSLSHLHRFPLDEIKIDKLFIENLVANRHDRVIVQSLVAIAQGLGLALVAEGVERPEAVEALWRMGCRGFQGFLISMPLEPGEFAAFCDRLAAQDMRLRL